MDKLFESKKVCSPKSRVQFDTNTVRAWVLPLLMRIDVGDYPTKAGRIIGLSRQHTWYYIRKLEKCKLIRREKRSNVVFYELTPESKNLLTSCEGKVFPARLYRFDKCQVAYEIIADGLVPENFKKVEMINWTALLGTELGVRVRKTSRSWIVHVEVIRGRNPVEVTNLAVNLANRVRDALVSKYGCVLGEPKTVAGEMACEDPVASLFGRYFTVRTDKRRIDHSWTVGELEHLQRDAVVEYLQMPERAPNIMPRTARAGIQKFKAIRREFCAMKPVYFDLTVQNAKEARQFFERVFDWHFEKFPMPYEYYRIQAGPPNEPGIDGGIGEVKDAIVGGGKPLTQVTIGVPNLDEFLERVKQNGGSIIEPKMAIPGIGWYATCAEPGGLPFGMIQADPNAR